MGTRNMTMVIDQGGNTKVAQYGQWDGYPAGVGVNILKFLRNTELFEKFKNNLHRVRFLDASGVDKDFIESYDKNAPEWSSDPDNRTKEQINWFNKYITRDLAEEVLTNIAESTENEIILIDRSNTAKGDDSWVEWSYIINLKENTLGVYGLIDREPIMVYSLDNLPTDEVFINDLGEPDDY